MVTPQGVHPIDHNRGSTGADKRRRIRATGPVVVYPSSAHIVDFHSEQSSARGGTERRCLWVDHLDLDRAYGGPGCHPFAAVVDV